MDILENDLEDIIFEMIKDNANGIWSLGISEGIILRQVTLGNYGTVDLLNISFDGFEKDYRGKIYREWTATVIELKRGKLGYNELGQLSRYMAGLNRIIECKNYKKDKITVKGILIGKEVEEDSDYVFMFDLLKNIEVFEFKLNYKTGLEFEESCGWFKSGNDFTDIEKKYINSEDIKKIFTDYINYSNDFQKAISNTNLQR